MKNVLLILALAGYLSACAPTTETTTTQTPTAESTSDANASDNLTIGSDTANATASDSADATLDTASASGSDMEKADVQMDETKTESEVLGTSTVLTMDQLPKAVRDAYLKMPRGENSSAVKISQVSTAKYPVLYKLESTSASTDNVHYYTPDGQEVPMPKMDQ